MKNKAFTLVEALVVTLISISLLGVIFGVFLVGRNSWAKSAAYTDLQEKTRYAMDKMVRELSLSKPTEVTIGDCSHPNYNCYGQYIEFNTPVVTSDPVANTIYHEDGSIKFGTKDHEGWKIKYLAMQGGVNDHRLMRIIPEEPTGACCIVSDCSVKTQQNCLNLGGVYKGNGVSCSANLCGGGGGGCFLAGTPILMADRNSKPIEKVKPGDYVMAFDEKTGKLVEDKVSVFFEHDADKYLVINDYLKVTANHPLYSQGKWVPAGKLNVGDTLLNSRGEIEKITTIIKKTNEPVKVYNLEVNPYHTYIAGGFVVHNKEEGGGGDGIGGGGDDFPPPGPGGRLRDPFDFLRNCFLEAIAFADETLILASDIKTLEIVNPNLPAAPNIIDIKIIAEKKSMLGEIVEVTLSSRVYLRN